MAHFAQLDENNKVISVHVVANHVIADNDGNDDEQKGIEYLQKLHGNSTSWKQTSYNANFRVNHAGRGMAYDAENDMFYYPVQPYPSWSYNKKTGDWDAPVEKPIHPDDRPCIIAWNEDTGAWDITDI
jgi:hypothetical protein